ncbi:hypothetical protein AAFF_G00252280 [Aldrovandia affinis]|uniref:Uncharacterized protein n=1 Tax=Aldrovandia affinis TaxID=143900 RepID=A0AAD7STW5_9TELE|nr:hypothetical protein AAFF_G00252280 [Aldrovandia affinis]
MPSPDRGNRGASFSGVRYFRRQCGLAQDEKGPTQNAPHLPSPPGFGREATHSDTDHPLGDTKLPFTASSPLRCVSCAALERMSERPHTPTPLSQA